MHFTSFISLYYTPNIYQKKCKEVVTISLQAITGGSGERSWRLFQSCVEGVEEKKQPRGGGGARIRKPRSCFTFHCPSSLPPVFLRIDEARFSADGLPNRYNFLDCEKPTDALSSFEEPNLQWKGLQRKRHSFQVWKSSQDRNLPCDREASN